LDTKKRPEKKESTKEIIEKQANAFIAKMGIKPKFDQYGAGELSTKYIKRYYDDKDLGGGPLVQPVKARGEEIETPFIEDCYNIKGALERVAEEGKEYGGFLSVKGLEIEDTNPKQFMDWDGLMSPGKTCWEKLRKINGTDQSKLPAGEKKKWGDLKDCFTGIGRSIVYEEYLPPTVFDDNAEKKKRMV